MGVLTWGVKDKDLNMYSTMFEHAHSPTVVDDGIQENTAYDDKQ